MPQRPRRPDDPADRVRIKRIHRASDGVRALRRLIARRSPGAARPDAEDRP